MFYLAIEKLWDQFDNFPSSALVGLAVDQQPFYWESLKYHR